MIKRDPQEIADFFGCKVLVNPFSEAANLNADDDSGYCIGYLKKHTVVSCENHDKTTIIFEPQRKQRNSENKNNSCSQDYTDSDNNAPHQSEVHTHREYCVIKNETPVGLSKQATKLIDKGYNPVGGIAIGYEYGACPRQYFYQAMVRGWNE